MAQPSADSRDASTSPQPSRDGADLCAENLPASLSRFKAVIVGLGGLLAGGGAAEAIGSDRALEEAVTRPARTAPLEPGKKSGPPSSPVPVLPGGFALPFGPGFGPATTAPADLFFKDFNKRTEELLKGLLRQALTKEAQDTIAKEFDLKELKLVHHSPGLIEFSAKRDGREQKFVAAGKDLFVVTSVPTERDLDALKKAEAACKVAEAKADKAKEEIKKLPAYSADFDLIRWSGSLARVDTAHMPKEVREKFETACAAMGEYQKAQATLSSLKEISRTTGLERYKSDKAGKAILVRGASASSPDYELVHLGKDGHPERWMKYDSKNGRTEDIDIAAAVAKLGKNDMETYGPVARVGQYAAPKLKQALSGKMEVPEAERPALQLVAGYLLAKTGDKEAIDPLFRIVRGQVTPKDAYTKISEIDDAVLGMGPAIAPEMIEGLKDPNPKVRILAARFFQKHPDRSAVETLKENLDHKDKYVRRHSALALGLLRDEAALPHLITLLEQNVPNLSGDAAVLLACYPKREALTALTDALADPLLAKHAAEGVNRSNDPATVGVLKAHALGENPAREICPGLMRWATRGNSEAREAMILGCYNPRAGKEFRNKVEAELVSLSPAAEKELPELAKRLLKALPKDAPEWHKGAYETFITARALGIEYVNRIPEEHRAEVFANRINPKRDDRPLAVLIMGRGDHNGAFYLSDTIFRDLITHKYRVMYYEADSDQDLVKSLKAATAIGTKQEQRASIIVFGGHGSQSSLHLERDNLKLPDKRGILDPGDEAMLKKENLNDCLEKNGFVILDSCCNGSGKEKADGLEGRPLNMANFMRRIFPDAMPKGIFSATESYGPIKLKFDKENRLIDVEYPVPQYRALADIRRDDSVAV